MIFTRNGETNRFPTKERKITRGRWQTSKIAFPLEDLSADVFCKNASLHIRNGKARSGDANLKVEMDWNGMTKQSPLLCIAEVNNLELNQRLFQSLPSDIQETWKKLRATGRVDASVYSIRRCLVETT